MRIQIDDSIYLTSDSTQFMLVETKIIQDGKNKGNEYDSTLGYYGSIPEVIKAYVKQKQLESNATTLQELLTETRVIYQYVKNLFEQKGD